MVDFHTFHRVIHIPRKEGHKMFLGEFIHSTDAKGRVFIPAKFREALGENFVVTRSVDHCLCVYPLSEWEKFTAKLDALPMVQARDVRRFFYSAASDASLDSQGRVLIPQVLRDYAKLEKDTVVIGVNSYIEIWAQSAWEAKKASEDAQSIENLMIALEARRVYRCTEHKARRNLR